jgi:hypothetical protein
MASTENRAPWSAATRRSSNSKRKTWALLVRSNRYRNLEETHTMRSVRLTFTGNIMFLQIEPGGRAVEQQAIEKIVAPYIRDGRIIRDDLLALAGC